MSFLELSKARYSVRSFKAQPIELEKLTQVLEAGRIAPTACNNQPHRIKVINTPEDLTKVDECSQLIFMGNSGRCIFIVKRPGLKEINK